MDKQPDNIKVAAPADQNMTYVLICRECDDACIPFPSSEARGAWAAEHTAGTGHNLWTVIDLPNDHADLRPIKRGREYETGPVHYAGDGCTDHR